MMREGYSKDVDFYALGCIMFFMLTSELLATKTRQLSQAEVERVMVSRGVSQEAIDLFLMLTDKNNRIDNSRGLFF
jgi:serine/threonine protein kinase